MVMCREAGYFNLSDIQTAVFEYNGKLAILPVSDKRPMIPADNNLMPKQETISAEIIMDGRVMDENLQRMGLDEKWLQKQGFHSAKEIFLGLCDTDHKVTLFQGE